MKLIRTHYCNQISKKDNEQTIILNGWIDTKRDHGNLIFVDLRDRTGIIQIVVNSTTDKECHNTFKKLGIEYVVAIQGKVVIRSPRMVNKNIPSGDIEVKALTIQILNESLPLPFSLNECDGDKIHEDLLFEYRFLALRQNFLKENLIKRHEVVQSVHRFLNTEGFIELETPILNKSTPEGARDFVVPSRLNHGKFYALPQSPQIFKQLFMGSGFDRYYQIARCFRDEDLRADRQPEFTQIDMEMSFVNKEMIMRFVEKMFHRVFTEVYKLDLQLPFPVMSYEDSIKKYGTDKPDIRFNMPIFNVSDVLAKADFELFRHILKEDGEVVSLNVKNAGLLTQKDIENFTKDIIPFGGKALIWMKVKNNQLESNVIKYFNELVQKELIHRLNGENGDLFLLVAGDPMVIYRSLGTLRLQIAKKLNLIDSSKFAFAWIINFPLFEYSWSEKRYKSFHHPFTLPNMDYVNLLNYEPLKVKAESYDLILNGVEIGGGSLRIFQRELQENIFRILGFTQESYMKQFGFFLKALEYGVPPHGGIAFGLDRILMILQKESSIRNVMAFPKTQKGACLMSQSPGFLSNAQLMDLNIQLT